MKYKIGDKVVMKGKKDLEDNVIFKKYAHQICTIVDINGDLYKVEFEEGNYKYILEERIDHEATAKLKNEFRYKVGDKVKIKDTLNNESIFSLANQILEIEFVDTDDKNLPYRVSCEDFTYWVGDDEIDHEATARLNSPKLLNIDKEFEKIATEILTNNIEEMKNSNPTIKVSKIGDKIICSKGGETMNANEILEKWHNKRYVELRNKTEDEKQKVTKQDEIQKLFEEHEMAIQKTIKEKYKIDVVVEHTFFAVLTPKTQKKLAEIEDKCKAEERELDEKIKEIKAVLEVAENQDKVFEILNKQGIIDKNYNIL